MRTSEKTRKLTAMAMLVAISVILVALIRFPIFPTAAFLEYDLADVPIFIGAFVFGPTVGIILTVVASVVQGLTVSAASGIIGVLMHVVATGSFVLVASSIYHRNRSLKNAVIGLVCGTITMTIMMVIWNLIMTPIFMGAPRSAVISMLVPIIIPFNLIKAGVNSLITFVAYKKLSVIINRYVNHEVKEKISKPVGDKA